jgi:hypothetical protein
MVICSWLFINKSLLCSLWYNIGLWRDYLIRLTRVLGRDVSRNLTRSRSAAAPVDAIKINGCYVTVLRSVATPIKVGTSRSGTKFKHDFVNWIKPFTNTCLLWDTRFLGSCSVAYKINDLTALHTDMATQPCSSSWFITSCVDFLKKRQMT